jgi:tRNA U38,U39,U40 pseudouridine synthase TruA
MFKTGDRSINRNMAPPDGLYLVKIIYKSAESKASPDSGNRNPEAREEDEE